MSKKSRRRNKRLLMLAALAGGAAMMGRGKGAVSTVGQPVGVNRMSTNAPPILGTDHIKKVVAPVDTAVTNVKKPIRTDIYKGSGKKVSDAGQTIGAAGVDSSGLSRGEKAQILAANAAKNRALNYQRSQTFDAKPRFGVLSNARINEPGSSIIKTYKKGGRVTGVAKRGFGRALMKGKK